MPPEAVAAPAVPVTANQSTAQIAQTPPKEPAAPEPVAKIRVRAHDRAVKVKEALAKESPATESEEPDDEPAAETQAPEAAPKKPEPPKVDDDAAKRRQERQERILKAQQRERAEERARERERSSRAPSVDTKELETLRKRVAELEPMSSVFASEEALLEAAEARGMSTEKLVQWMRSRLTDPAAVARQQSKSEADRLRDELRQAREENQREIAKLREEREAERQHAEAMKKAVDFVGRARTSVESHPLTSNFVARHGEHGLINFANQFVAPLLRTDYSVDELHDHLEQFLDEVQLTAAQQRAAAAGAPEQAARHLPKNGEEQPSTTLSNRLVAQRGSVEEAVPLARLPRSERVARLKAQLGGD